MERGAFHYREGEVTGFEIVAKYVTAELAYIVWIEQTKAKIGGGEEIAPFDLRVTMIFRPEDGEWKVVHRHADPITTAQPAESLIQNWIRCFYSPHSPGPIAQKRFRVGPRLRGLPRKRILYMRSSENSSSMAVCNGIDPSPCRGLDDTAPYTVT
jgi:hypothetical protein